MRIIGLDPGLRHTGWGIIDVLGNHLTPVSGGTIDTNAKESMANRLKTLHDKLYHIIGQWEPNMAAVEETFVNQNPKSTLKLGMARGVVMVAPALQGLPVYEYSANMVKKSVVGAGHAGKEQIQMMVKTLLPKADLDTADTADAFAIAICHAHHHQSHQITGKAS